MSFGASAIGTLPYGDGTGGSSIVYYGVTLVSPVDNSTTGSFYPTFTSLPNSSDGSAMEVEWQWDTDISFANAGSRRQTKTTAGNTDETNALTAPDAALYNGPIYWRTRAGDGTNWSTYTTGWKLNVATIPMATTSYVYENTGTEQALPSKDSTAVVYENTGVILTASRDSTAPAYENTGVLPGTPLTIIRQPRGWGVIPTGPQSITILTESSAGTVETYENIQ